MRWVFSKHLSSSHLLRQQQLQDTEALKAALNRQVDERRAALEQEITALAAEAAMGRSELGLELDRRAAELKRSEEDLAVRFKMIQEAQVCCSGVRGMLLLHGGG